MNNLLQLVEPGHTPELHANERKMSIGIDLGTTHSVAAMVVDGRPTVMRLEGGSALIPSAVAYGETLQVGQSALQHDNVLTSTKRLMGRGTDDPVIDQFPQVVDDGSKGVYLKADSQRIVSPVEVSAAILGHIKDKAEEVLGESVEQAVITVPAYFDDGARAATRDAARLAGLQVLRLINEPTAAALAYGLENNVEGIYAVYDFGGGTFDISLLKLQKGVFQVLATGGDLTLGGDDVDRALCECFKVEPSPENQRVFRRAKEALSEAEEFTVVIGGKHYQVTQKTLEDATKPLIKRAQSISQNVLADAGVSVQDIEGVVLVGGSTRLRCVVDAVESFFGKPPLMDINPDEAVALGAAAQAHGLTGDLKNLLLDVIPLSLGLETMGGLVEKILHRNSPIPAMAKQEFTTYQDGQTGLVVHVVQGEREFVDDCRSLARFELTGIPSMAAGVARIEIQFNVDVDGLLTVSAKELTTGKFQHVEVKPSYGLTSEQMASMLEESLRNGQDDMNRRLLEEARVEAERLIHDVNAALDSDGDLLNEKQKTLLLSSLQELTESLDSPDREPILAAHEALDQASQEFAEMRLNHGMQKKLVGTNLDQLGEVS